MGRRRRHRHGGNGLGPIGPLNGDGDEETLAPTYVTVRERLWNAESDTPVLALDGLRPWEEIRGPALLLEEEGATLPDGYIADSHDPQQLDLTTPNAQDAQDAHDAIEEVVAPVVAEAPVEPERPVLVLEPEPPVEVQAELPLVAPAAEAEPVAAIEPEAPPPVDPIELLCESARTAMTEGRAADARALWEQVLAERPTHTAARNELAQLLESAGDQQGALAHYDRGLESDAESATLLSGRGALLGAMGRYAAAERDLKRVLRAEPAQPAALFHLGVVMARKGLWAEAVPQLRRAIELDPSRGAAYFYLGEALNHVDDLYGAMASYQRASELMPEHPRALYGLGIVYDRLGRPDDAARMYRRSREVGRR